MIETSGMSNARRAAPVSLLNALIQLAAQGAPDKPIGSMDWTVAVTRLAEQAQEQRAALIDALKDAELQLAYLNDKFGPTGTTNAVLARIGAVLATAAS